MADQAWPERDMKGKVCLVTGATSGIGLVTARELAQRGARVVLTGRNANKCAAVVSEIRQSVPGADVEALVADLAVLEQVRGLAGQFRERHSRLDVLVNNAGVILPERQVTPDGLERTFAVNHLAYYLLTNLLEEPLRAAPARVVNVASAVHGQGKLDFDDLQMDRRYSGWRQYCNTKLMNLLFTFELDRLWRGRGVAVNALHPGWVDTGIRDRKGWQAAVFRALKAMFALSPEQGAQTTLYLATAADVEGVSGRYFVRRREARPARAALDEAAARRLWEVSRRITGVPAE